MFSLLIQVYLQQPLEIEVINDQVTTMQGHEAKDELCLYEGCEEASQAIPEEGVRRFCLSSSDEEDKG